MVKKNPASSLEPYRKKRDFGKTDEPAGGPGASRKGHLRFVVQKHAATHLHFDLRLEMGGVMRSWAVPKGPSMDPDARRLAMEVEDHPIEYNDFEGTIPEGEYGGGTVMLWDQGVYVPEEVRKGEDEGKAAIRAYRAGKLSFTCLGDRLEGSFALVRTELVEGGARSKWLLIKHRDDYALPGSDVAESESTSIVTGRTMDEIASGAGGKRVWRSNRGKPKPPEESSPTSRDPLASLRPMLATTGREVPTGGDWVFEPKYDGIRVLAFATPQTVVLTTRNGNDRSAQFPEVRDALLDLVSRVGEPLVLDGEIVPIHDGEIARFERLQSRMHLRNGASVKRLAAENPAAILLFDVLLKGDEVLVESGWRTRRKVLESLFRSGDVEEGVLISEVSEDHAALLKRGREDGWEGLMAKRSESRYRPGTRSQDWLKLKLENRQEFVVGGWTEPRRSRSFIGALLLGYYDGEGKLVYAGHTGTGLDQRALEDLHRRFSRLERKTSPFASEPRTNEAAHWVTPKVVVEVRFNEWTRDGKLRQPVYLGVRDDKNPNDVVRETAPAQPGEVRDHREPLRVGGRQPAEPEPIASGSIGSPSKKPKRAPATTTRSRTSTMSKATGPLLESIRSIPATGDGDGVLAVARGASLPVTSLNKVFFPKTGHTKRDVLTYYARMAEHVLPATKDRPLVLKRFPNGVDKQSFYQHSPPENVPPGVRVETIQIDGEDQRRLVGGNLATLLYSIQLGAISYDPWHSRAHLLNYADYSILDLDPGPEADFNRVVEVANWVREEMEESGLTGVAKTSGSSGLHIYLPLPPRTPLDAATLVAQIVATRVARRHPKHATVERMIKNRPPAAIYVDYLQNILGKTVAGVYAVRARPTPTVSTPVAWDELIKGLDPRKFTIDTVPARVEKVGDLWGPGMAVRNDLGRLMGLGE